MLNSFKSTVLECVEKWYRSYFTGFWSWRLTLWRLILVSQWTSVFTKILGSPQTHWVFIANYDSQLKDLIEKSTLNIALRQNISGWDVLDNNWGTNRAKWIMVRGSKQNGMCCNSQSERNRKSNFWSDQWRKIGHLTNWTCWKLIDQKYDITGSRSVKSGSDDFSFIECNKTKKRGLIPSKFDESVGFIELIR